MDRSLFQLSSMAGFKILYHADTHLPTLLPLQKDSGSRIVNECNVNRIGRSLECFAKIGLV